MEAKERSSGWFPGWRVGAIVALTPLLFGAHEGTWLRTAESHLRFARELAAEGVAFDLAFRARVVEDRLAACGPRPSRLRDLPVSDRLVLQRYALLVCVPTWKAWSKGFGECADRLFTPRWCDSGDDAVIAEHLGLGAYFETMTAAIAATSSRLEKANIIGVLADFLRADALRHHPIGPLDLWVGEVTTLYLRDATPDEGVAAAEPLLLAGFGSDGAFPPFRAFRDSAPLSEGQRCVINALMARKNPAECPGYVESVHRPTEQEEILDLQSLQQKALRQDNLKRLRSRIETFYERRRDCEWDAVYDMLTIDLHELSWTPAEWTRGQKWLSGRYQLVKWQVIRILVFGNRAKVWTSETDLVLKGRDKGKESSREGEMFWILEEGDWRSSWGRPQYDFNDQLATEVPVEEEMQ